MNNTQQAKINWIIGAAAILALFILPYVLARFGKTGEFWIWVTTEMIILPPASIWSLGLGAWSVLVMRPSLVWGLIR
jgi:hypothetical protein